MPTTTPAHMTRNPIWTRSGALRGFVLTPPFNVHHKYSSFLSECTRNQPLRGVPCGYAADCKCRNIMNENLYPLKLLIKNVSKIPSAIIVATPQPTNSKIQMKSKTFHIIYLQKRKKWMSAAKAAPVLQRQSKDCQKLSSLPPIKVGRVVRRLGL